jgi:hypothetical protein
MVMRYLHRLAAAAVVCFARIASAQLSYQTVALTGQAVPGAGEGVMYATFSPQTINAPKLNDVGLIAYSATLSGPGVTDANNAALLAGGAATPQLFLRKGDPAPGAGSGVVYGVANPGTLNDAGQISYFAQLSGPGITQANDTAEYVGSLMAPSQLSLREGAPLEAQPGA